MKKVGYIYGLYAEGYIKEQRKALEKANLDTIIIEKDLTDMKDKNDTALNEIISLLKEGDQLVVYELQCLGKAIVQLGEFLEEISYKGIELIVLNKNISQDNISYNVYNELIISISKAEKVVISERTSRGLKEARRKGRVGGRPKVSQETIEKIQYLYSHQFYTLREIADECDVSLGTAYKYVQKD